MYTYKLVASDLDGTLLNSKAEVSKENISAISELAKRGIHFVLSTGRTFAEIPDVLKNSPDIRYSIYSNGAVVYDKVTGKRIFTCIPNELVRNILDTVNRFETHVTVRYEGCAFVDKNFQSDYHFEYYNVCDAHKRVVRDFAVYSDDFHNFSYSADNVEDVSVFFRNYEDKIRCKDIFSKISSLRVVEVDKFNIEILNSEAGKGNALHSLADMLGIEYSETVSIGDSDNDRSSIEAAGLGLAVSNSTEALKKAADEVICSNEEHAVQYVLSHYFSCGVI